MKKILTIVVLLLLTFSVSAQTYHLWMIDRQMADTFYIKEGVADSIYLLKNGSYTGKKKPRYYYNTGDWSDLGYTPVPNTRTVNGRQLNSDISIIASDITSGTFAPDRLAPGSGLQVLRRNSGNTALEFVTLAGGGDLLAANNLSDIANAATARTNLGVNTTANISASTNKNFVSDAQLTVVGNTSGTNSGDNAANTTYANDYRAANFVAGTNYLAPTGNGSGLTGLTKSQISGIDQVDNTSDANKPVSIAAQEALDAKANLSSIQSRTWLTSDVTNANVVANTLADVTGLSFAVTSGVTYKFKFFIVYTSAATTTGSRWTINGPATTFVNYTSIYTLTATSITNNAGVSAYNSPSGASASSLTSGNIAVIEGIIKPSANGTVIARFASEITLSAIVAKANQSYVEWLAIN